MGRNSLLEVCRLFWASPGPEQPVQSWSSAGSPCMGQMLRHGSGPVLVAPVWAKCGDYVLALCWQPMYGPDVETLFWPSAGGLCMGQMHGPSMAQVWNRCGKPDLAPHVAIGP